MLKQAERAAFAFGVHDCATLAADCLDAMTDSNYRARLGELYKSEREALRIMAQHGQLEALVTEALQLRPVPRNLARRGDLVACTLDTGPALGICVGERVAVAGDGVRFLPLEAVHCAWRI